MLIGARDIVERCVFAMLNEAARCLEEGIIASSPRDGDVGAVFGIGFPPFRGGPFRYLDTLGIPTVIRALEVLNGRFSPRFRPARMLREMAAFGGAFLPGSRAPALTGSRSVRGGVDAAADIVRAVAQRRYCPPSR